ncbi:MAG: electron transporter YccM [Bryobacteraceae bacterium]|nr:MAG: electron transporter YccM [Bryobacteraceae bacterium]
MAAPARVRREKKAYRKREGKDRSQAIRFGVQAAFLLLNVWIGVEFYLWVRAFETGGVPPVSRPPGVEGWLPIAGMMNSKYFFTTGQIPAIHPAAMVLFLTFVGLSLLLRKAFCGWLCPVGTLSEYLWKLGRETFRRNFSPPRWLDIGLRSLKYVLLGLFVYAVGSMPAEGLHQFLTSPFGIVADVKMLNFFRYLSVTAAIVIGILVILSIFIQNFWCRYLCPYGALMGLAALVSPLRIRRRVETCIDCGKCAKACPARLPVDRLVQIRSAECIGCLECVAACPVADTLEMRATGVKRRVPAWAMAAAIVLIFCGATGWAMWAGHWQTHVPDEAYRELIPRAHEFSHP